MSIGLGLERLVHRDPIAMHRPSALVVIGGILLAPVLILGVLAVLIDIFSRRAIAQAHPLGGASIRDVT
jgi:hypothetical protein